jgi:ABC-2 type transport system permease protein
LRNPEAGADSLTDTHIMRKTLIVAQSEFATLVRSKAFLVGIVLMPVMMALSIYLVRATKDSTDGKDRTFAVVDYSGVIAEPLKGVAALYNASSPVTAEAGLPRKGPRFVPVVITPNGRTPDELRLELSDRVRRQEFFAFVEFPANIVDPSAGAHISYYSDHPSYNALPQWLRATVNAVVLNERFRQASVDRALVVRLTKQAPIEELGLFEHGAGGGVTAAKEVDAARAYGVPVAVLVLMYITIMSSAPQLLNSVIEEKMSRISEVLIGSVTPFQLMMGKLAGGAAASLLLSAIYIAGGLAIAQYGGGYASAVTPAIVAWFVLFLLMALFIFGSLFVAIGAACNDLKDSQNMMTPVMLLVMLPMFTAGSVLRAPDGTLALVLSMIPTAAPFLMLLRIALQPAPPLWQILISVGVMVATVVVVVWAAGKIFRTGLLMQGKSATIPEMLRWVKLR